MKKIKLYRETDSRNIFLCPQLGFLLYTELLPICLLRKTSNISRRVSRRGIGTVLSTQTQIWPYSSLYFLPRSRASSQLQGFNLLLLWFQETIFFFFGHTAFTHHFAFCFCLHLGLYAPSHLSSPPRKEWVKTKSA